MRLDNGNYSAEKVCDASRLAIPEEFRLLEQEGG